VLNGHKNYREVLKRQGKESNYYLIKTEIAFI